MTKQTKLSIIATTILLGLFWLFIYANQTKADDSDSRKIWDLEYMLLHILRALMHTIW